MTRSLASLVAAALLLCTTATSAQTPARPGAKPAAGAASAGQPADPAAGTPAPGDGAPAAGTPAPGAAGTDPAAATTTGAPSAPPDVGQPTAIRQRSLEQRVQALKEQSWRIKARVDMLKEVVLGGGVGARASIVHENKMGGAFRLVRLVYALDGMQIFAKTDDSGSLHELKKIDVLTGPIAPGNHTLSVLMVYRGHGYDVFKYLKGYKFTVRSSHTFTASEGKQTRLTVIGYERGGVTTPLEKRPAVDFKVNVTSDRGGPTAGK